MMLSPILTTNKYSPSAPSASRTTAGSGREDKKAFNALSLARFARAAEHAEKDKICLCPKL